MGYDREMEYFLNSIFCYYLFIEILFFNKYAKIFG